MKKITLTAFCVLFFSHLQAQFGVGYSERGIISYYTERKTPRITASGEKYDNSDLVGCHPKLPFNTKVKITNLANNKSVIVRINDRGPYAYGRIMDISEAAAKKIDLITTGTAKVDMEVIDEPQKEEISREKPKMIDEKVKDTKVVTAVNDSQFLVNQTYSQWGTLKNPMGYTIQIGSFDTYKKATDFCKLVRDKGFKNEKIFIEVVEANQQKMFKVLLGEFEEKKQADEMAFKYKSSLNQGGWVRKHTR